MKPKHIIISILTVLFMVPLIGTFAQSGAPTIQVITSFDYPGDTTQTIPEGINDHGDITGLYVDSVGITRGFVRFGSGVFSAPIVEPNDTGNLSEGRGINLRAGGHSRQVGGFYAISDGTIHGFFLQQGIYSEFDVSGAFNTYVEGLNDAGDFVGANDSTGLLLAYKNVAGTTTTIDISGATNSYAFGINMQGECTGQYTDATGFIHGYFADPSGAITTFDPTGSTGTLPFGISNRSLIVGRYIDSAGVNHGFLLKLPAAFVIFDYPGSVFTSMNGINAQGLICGRYQDVAGILHGFLARVVR